MAKIIEVSNLAYAARDEARARTHAHNRTTAPMHATQRNATQAQLEIQTLKQQAEKEQVVVHLPACPPARLPACPPAPSLACNKPAVACGALCV